MSQLLAIEYTIVAANNYGDYPWLSPRITILSYLFTE